MQTPVGARQLRSATIPFLGWCVAILMACNASRAPANTRDVAPSADTNEREDTFVDAESRADAPDVADVTDTAAATDASPARDVARDVARDGPAVDAADAARTDHDVAPAALLAVARCHPVGRDDPPSDQVFAFAYEDIACSAADSVGAATYRWELISSPANGFGDTLIGENTTHFTLAHASPGTYLLRLTVSNAAGTASASADVRVSVSMAPSEFRVQLAWFTEEAPLADLDLHVVHPGGCWGDTDWDAHTNSEPLAWGEVWEHQSGHTGLERFTLEPPGDRGEFWVAVRIPAATNATLSLRSYVHGTLYFEERDVAIVTGETDTWWVAFAFDYRAVEITPIGRYYDTVPPCPSR